VEAPTELSREDPLLIELRREITAACQADTLLDRSADILLALVFNVENEEYPGFAVDAIEEIIGEALARGKLDLAVRALAALGSSAQLTGEAMREHARRFALFRQRIAGRTHVSLVAGVLRQNVGADQIALAAEYLRRVAREGAEEFTGLLADERDRRVRGRMCQVLAGVGPSVVPVLLPWLEDTRWYVVRNVLYILGKVGDESTFMSVVGVLDHAHPRVRLEAIRVAALVGGGTACGPILRQVGDPDPAVRQVAVRTLATLKNDDAVPALRDLVASRGAVPEDLELRQEAIRALAAIGSPFARAALTRLAARRAWFWERAERRIRSLAAEALQAGPAAALSALEVDDVG
jgi:HEAT repeat protein